MKLIRLLALAGCIGLMGSCTPPKEKKKMSGNPVFPGWYADPEGIVFDNEFWIYPTLSSLYGEDEEPTRKIRKEQRMLSIKTTTCKPISMLFHPKI